MKLPKTIGLLICSLRFASSIADAETSPGAKEAACSIELGRLRSPHAYLVAIVENLEQPQCDGSACTQALTIVRVLAAGDLSGQLSSINVGYSLKTRNKGAYYPTGRTVGVFVPLANGDSYKWLISTSPLLPTVISDYEQAVEIAASARTGAPDCEKQSS